MNKRSKPVLDDGGDFGAELSEAEMDAWVERNREALKASLQAARDGLARGEVDTRTFAAIIAEGTRRHLAKR